MFLSSLREKFLKNLLLLVFVFSLNGCVYLVVGGVGALGGYVVSPDTVEGIVTNHDKMEIWDAAVAVISVMGVIEEQDEGAGIMLAKINRAKVTLTITPINENAVQLKIKSRKAIFPKIKVSQDVYVKIERYVYGFDG